MDAKKFYELIGGDYNDALSRLMNDQLINKFVDKFFLNQKVDLLENSLKNKDYEVAFREIHTLKGVSLNLSFTSLSKVAFELTEILRNYKDEPIDEQLVNKKYLEVKECFNKHINVYKSLN